LELEVDDTVQVDSELGSEELGGTSDLEDNETGVDSELEIEWLDSTSEPEFDETGVDSELELGGFGSTSEPEDDDTGSDLELETPPVDCMTEEDRATQKLELERVNDMIRALALSPDGKVLALASNGHPIRLWDVESREVLQDLGRHNNYTVTLSSSAAGTRIDDFTSCDVAEHTACSHETTPGQTQATTILEIKNQWLRYLGQDVLWLPQEFRGSSWSAFGHQIAIGQSSGPVSFFQYR
jgi:WD40 repeat protein